MGEVRRELTEAERADAARRGRRRLGCTLFALVAGLLLPEVLMRWFLFGSGPLAESYGAELRDPGNFADPQLDTEYWTLRHALGMHSPVRHKDNRHPALGWRPRRLDPDTLRHPDELQLRGRRPILLYGASYAACVTSHAECFQGLVATSGVGKEYALLNYGCGGYGVDQVLLLMQRTLDLYAELDPVVVVLPVVDSDFERCSLDFRALPKPRFELVDGELRSTGPLAIVEPDEYLEEYGVGITSYAWSYLLHADTELPLVPRRALLNHEVRQAEQVELIGAILRAMEEELVRRDLEHFFLLATSPRGLPPNPVPPMEEVVVGVLREADAPFVLARDYAVKALEKVDGESSRLFVAEGKSRNHPTPLGNWVLFRAMTDGLKGRFTAPGG